MTERTITNWEREVFSLLAIGYNRVDTSTELNATENAIQLVVQRVRARLGAKNTVHAVAILVEAGELNTISRTVPDLPSDHGPVTETIWKRLNSELDVRTFRALRRLYDDAVRIGA